MKLLRLLFLLTILFVVPCTLSAQTDQNHLSHFSVGVSGGLTGDQLDLTSDEVTSDELTSGSAGHLGYLGNVSTAYRFGKHFKLSIAAELQSKHIEYRIDGLHFASDFNGTGFNDSHIIYQTKASIIAVPLTAEYIFGTKKLLPFISMGLAAEFIVNQNSDGTIYYSNGTTEPVSAENLVKQNNIAVVTGAGVYYTLTNKISLSVSPLFSYSMLEGGAKSHRYSFGVRAGVFYNL